MDTIFRLPAWPSKKGGVFLMDAVCGQQTLMTSSAGHTASPRKSALMAAVQYEEDRPLSDAEMELAAAALAAVPQELAAGAFGGDVELLSQLLARCVRGEKQNAAKSLLSTLEWRKDMEADTVRLVKGSSQGLSVFARWDSPATLSRGWARNARPYTPFNQ
jgi:hypothetical protein